MPPQRCGLCSPSGPMVRGNPFGGEVPPDGHSQEVVRARTTASPTGTSHYAEDAGPVSTVSAPSHRTRKRERTRGADPKYTRRRTGVNPGASVARCESRA
jgi:hypothetical protein